MAKEWSAPGKEAPRLRMPTRKLSANPTTSEEMSNRVLASRGKTNEDIGPPGEPERRMKDCISAMLFFGGATPSMMAYLENNGEFS